MSGTAHSSSAPPRSQHIDLSDSREPLSDAGAPAESLLPWRDQVRGFTRCSIQRPFTYTTPFSFDPLKIGRSELHLAAGNGQSARVARLLDHGEDVNISLTSGLTPLHLASAFGHVRIVELLLDHGAAIDAPTEDNTTSLAFAVTYRQLETAALLVARGAMVDASESLRAAVLYAAASTYNVGIIQMLLHLGLDVDAPFHGEKALHHIIRFGHVESVEVLLRNGADPSLRAEIGKTSLSIAAESGYSEIFELLWASGRMANYALTSASGKDISHILYRAVEGGSPVIVATVLQHTGADLNARFEDGTTPLSLASERGHGKVVEHLLVQGANPDVEAFPSEGIGREGLWKPLHPAVYFGYVKCIENLLRHGVDINARTEYGDTPLSLALERKRRYVKYQWPREVINEILHTLLSWGAVIDERSSLLLEEIARLEGSLKSGAELVVPGAWCEDAK